MLIQLGLPWLVCSSRTNYLNSFLISVSLFIVLATKFKELLGVKYYDENAFFRVSKNFMTLFGISGNPEANRQYTHAKFEDEPAKVSNKRGYLTFIPTGTHFPDLIYFRLIFLFSRWRQ